MTDYTLNLVDAIISGRATDIESAFQQAITDKISIAMESKRTSMAQSMFTKESVEILDEEQDPTGIKVYHTDKAGKTGNQIVFTHQDANRLHNQIKKSGGKVTHHALMFGTKEGEKKALSEDFALEDYSVEELEDFMMSEEFEQLDELSKKTLGSYVKKTSDDIMSKSGEAGFKLAAGEGDSGDKDYVTAYKRNKGIAKAVTKLTKEEVELEEVSQGTLDSYRKKSFDEPGEKREAGRKLAFAKSAGTSGDAKVSSTEEVTKAKSQIKDIIKPEHHAKYPISKITGFTSARKIYKQAAEAGHLKEEVELDD